MEFNTLMDAKFSKENIQKYIQSRSKGRLLKRQRFREAFHTRLAPLLFGKTASL
jgi:hypothetical protein